MKIIYYSTLVEKNRLFTCISELQSSSLCSCPLNSFFSFDTGSEVLCIGLFWRDILKVAKNFLGPEMPLSAFWCGKYDVTSQVHSWLLSFLSVEKQDTFPGGLEKKPTISFLFRSIREEHQQTQELLALLHHNEMFCIDDRWPMPLVKQQMWLSTPGGK